MTKLHDVVLFQATVVDLLDDGMVTYEISDDQGRTLALFDASANRPEPRRWRRRTREERAALLKDVRSTR